MSITVEEFGAKGEEGVNDQPAIQDAIDHAQANGLELWFTKPSYELWCPVRTSAVTSKFAPDGHPLVVQASVVLKGVGPERTTLDFKASDGSDPETNWQTVGGSVWRGGGLFLLGDQTDPGEDFAIKRFGAHRLIFKGNRAKTGSADFTDKGFWHQDTYVGEVALYDTDFVGWKGEIVYNAGYPLTLFHAERCKFLTGPHDALCLSTPTPRLLIQCEMGDCYQAEESVAAYDCRYLDCLWRDATYLALGGGNIDGLSGYPFSYPSRDETIEPPSVHIEGGEIRNVATWLVGSWTYAPNIKLVDTMPVLTTASAYGLRDVYVNAKSWIDQRADFAPLSFGGPADLVTAIPGTADYVQPPTNVHIKLSCSRTDVAIANNRHFYNHYWQGLIDPSCRVEIRDSDLKTQSMFCLDATPKSFPFLVEENLTQSSGSGYPPAYFYGTISASDKIIPRAANLRFATGTGTYDMTLETVTAGGSLYGYAHGQKLRLNKADNNGKVRFVKGGSGFRVPVTRMLTANRDWIEFAWNKWDARWEEIGFSNATVFSGTVLDSDGNSFLV